MIALVATCSVPSGSHADAYLATRWRAHHGLHWPVRTDKYAYVQHCFMDLIVDPQDSIAWWM